MQQSVLDSLNIDQATEENKENLRSLGGVEGLAKLIGVNMDIGLTEEQVLLLREKFGTNQFPESPMDSFFSLLFDALTDTTLLILIAAATVSLIIGVIQEPEEGWIDDEVLLYLVRTNLKVWWYNI